MPEANELHAGGLRRGQSDRSACTTNADCDSAPGKGDGILRCVHDHGRHHDRERDVRAHAVADLA